jgi:cellulose synthase (UDP-forming)
MNGTSDKIIKVEPPLKKDIYVIRVLICCGLIAMCLFLWWFFSGEHVGWTPLYILLTFALAFKLLKMLHEWYHYWSPGVPKSPAVTRRWMVDILTTACPGEPKEMIIRTLKAMQAITYPHTSYLCDEGDDPELREACRALGVVHVTRTVKIDAKAGNINNALKQATGEICVVLDPDHVPVPQFLDRVLPYFEDPGVGYVQCVQGYSNQAESFIARGAAEQTYHFYGPMMMCMNTYGTAQAIGANCTFRRAALDSIGGHAAGLSEDMHTAMQIHAKGWRSVYIPEMLTRGLVPATLSGYYKQQQKWARGTFELLFRTYPKLCRNFTWRQKIHYATLPLYFLYGLINLIDVSVPLLALCLAQVPWEVDLARFGGYFLTLCGCSLITRMYAQRWLLEKHECGFHFHGGILRTATWWIFLIGFVYTIFKIRVPYIPTPKEDEHNDCIRLSIPNLAVMALCILVIPYGLSIDYTPYSMAMASYAALTVCMLGCVVLVSQQRSMARLRGSLQKIPALAGIAGSVSGYARRCQDAAYQLLRNTNVTILAACSLMFVSYNIDTDLTGGEKYPEKETGGFYLGMKADSEEDLGIVQALSEDIRQPLTVISTTITWTRGNIAIPPLIDAVRQRHAMPHLAVTIPAKETTSFCRELIARKKDTLLLRCAEKFRRFGDPLFFTFSAPEAADSLFIAAWQYLYTFFNESGISNVTWVWTPPSAQSETRYPGEKFVDWLGVPAVARDGRSFADLYEPYRKSYGKFEKPVMITSLGCPVSLVQHEWFTEAFRCINKDYHEVQGAVLYEKKDDQADHTLSQLSRGFMSSALRDLLRVPPRHFSAQGPAAHSDAYSSPFIKGTPGHYTLMAAGAPYYIRGVAYNTAHDWRDGNMPLSRRQVEKDFARIKEMGANTVRRYGKGIYDRNVLNIAAEHDLKVLYGFWFDPKTDFFADEERVREYTEEVEAKVLAYRDHPAISAWTIGNETWGLLKHRFAKPYLVNVRRSYVRMVEQLARRIHELDPSRPVFTCIEHEEYQIAGELVAFRDEAPSLDAIGINSYYREQISKLNHITWKFDSLRPYLVSEFGPEGYWDPKYNNTANGSVIEQPESEKSEWYAAQWKNYVAAYRGFNIGGVAYCWHDRMEGSYTWFGLSDFKGRLKPAYFALKSAWTGKREEAPPLVEISAPEVLQPGMSYTVRAVTTGPRSGGTYEWMLLKDEYLDRSPHVEALDQPGLARLTVPEKPSDYRLYLFLVDDDRGFVSTASLPVKVGPRAK